MLRQQLERQTFDFGKSLIVNLKNVGLTDSLPFNCELKLNGSSSISFIPIDNRLPLRLWSMEVAFIYRRVFSRIDR